MRAHAAVAAQLYGDDALVWSAIGNLEKANLPEKDKAILCFVRKVTLESGSIEESGTSALHGAGWALRHPSTVLRAG